MIERRSAAVGHIIVKSSMFPMSRVFLVFPMLLALVTFVMLPSGGSLPALDCNGNGQEDASDIAGGVSQDCNANGIPDECDLKPEFAPAGQYSLASPCMYWMAWPRDTVMVSGDLDADGDPDLVTANCAAGEGGPLPSGSSVSIFLNRGDGSYAPEVTVPVGTTPLSVVLEDFDGDGDLDVATANFDYPGEGSVTVLLNSGDATFPVRKDTPLESPSELAAADFDGDGDIDLATAHPSGITILLNSGAAEWTPGANLDAVADGRTLDLKDIAAADLDGDGDADLAASDNYVLVWKNLGNAFFADPLAYNLTEGNHGLCWTHTLLAADVSGSGRPDLVTADYTDGGTPSVSILIQKEDGTFAGPTAYSFQLHDETQFVCAADFNLDGSMDLAATVGRTFCVLYNPNIPEEIGEIAFKYSYHEIDEGLSCIAAADVDLDGRPDLILKRWKDEQRQILVFKNKGASADTDGNGILDECEPSSVLIENDEEWRFFRGTEAPPAEWLDGGFDDAGWDKGPTGIGYGDNDDRTVLSDMMGNYISIFCRKVFQLQDPSAVTALALQMDFDDGFVAYLNGFEVARANMPAGDLHLALAAAALSPREPGEIATFDISGAAGFLLEGANVLAIQVHNSSVMSTDLSFIPRLLGNSGVPAAPSLAVSSADIGGSTPGDVWVLLTTPEPVQAFSLGVSHNPGVATLLAMDWEECRPLAALNGGAGPDFFSVDIDAGTAHCGPEVTAGGTVYCIASKERPETEMIPARPDQPIVHLRYDAAPGAADGAQSPLEIVGCLGDLAAWDLVLTIDRASVVPDVSSGTLTVVDGKVDALFCRGDGNLDGRQDISDVVVILAYLFQGAIEPTTCLDAADTTDDGDIDISDALRLLFWLFAGADPLPEPSEKCGPDPTIDGLACETYESCK